MNKLTNCIKIQMNKITFMIRISIVTKNVFLNLITMKSHGLLYNFMSKSAIGFVFFLLT